MKRSVGMKIFYILFDIAVWFGLSLLSFRAVYSFSSLTAPQYIAVFGYSAAISLVGAILFIIFNIYDTLVDNFSILDAFKICIIICSLQIVGLIVIVALPNEYFLFSLRYLFIWFLITVVLCFVIPTSRLVKRIYKLLKKRLTKQPKVRTLVIGAGDAAKMFIDDTRTNLNNNHKIVLLVDDDKAKIDQYYSNILVLGPISNVSKYITKYEIEEVVIGIANISEERLHEIYGYLSDANIRIKRIPLMSEMIGPNDIRTIDVDLNDLLSRDPIILDNKEVNEQLHKKVVLVTGAGGSIGSELVRQIFNTHPKTLVLFDIYENSTYDIQQELMTRIRKENIKDIDLITLIGSTYNLDRIEYVIKTYKPDYIYHAAAYKHVPLMEDSPMEAIRTNVLGTYNVAMLADKYNVKKMVLVSTDKAVRPTNVMGASKRFAEMIIQHFAKESKHTYYAAVRFGNVLGSNGSVVPLFKKQIENGGPITITDKNIIRYFMTIPEAVSLILQCGLYAKGGEIFILDMENPVKIIDLAEKLIRQAGLVPYKDIKIIETGLRPGEKLFEELLLDKKHQKATKHNKIFIEERDKSNQDIVNDIKNVSDVFKMDNVSDIKILLSKTITTYSINGGNK